MNSAIDYFPSWMIHCCQLLAKVEYRRGQLQAMVGQVGNSYCGDGVNLMIGITIPNLP
jgi:hypothetical protein